MGEYRRPKYRIQFARLARIEPAIPSIGHNGGPPLGEFKWPPGKALEWKQWSAASEAAFKSISPEIAIRRAKKAKALGLTYHEYTLEILERGRHLGPNDIERIAEIITARELRKL